MFNLINILLNFNSFDYNLDTIHSQWGYEISKISNNYLNTSFEIVVNPNLYDYSILKSIYVIFYFFYYFVTFFLIKINLISLYIFAYKLVYNFINFKIIFINLLLFILIYFHLNSHKQNIYKFLFKYLYYNIFYKIESFLKLDMFTQSNWYFILFISYLFYNFLSLLPKQNCLLTLLLIPVFTSLWFFFTQNFMSILINKESWLCVFYPGKLLFVIAPLIVLIELISYFMRPISLSLRIFANMLAGHILVHIISFYGYVFFIKGFFFAYFIVTLFLCILNVIEYFISMVQPLIYLALSCIYFKDLLPYAK